MKYLIIGAGAAGISAAAMLRKMDDSAVISVISSDELVHSRCMLHKVLGGARDEASINFTTPDFYERNRIRWVKGETVTKVDPAEKTVHLSCGAFLPYDKLLIAVGSGYVIPPIPHFREASNVFGFRDLCDEQQVEKALERGNRAFIVGSGLVGLDAASALLARGAQVTVAEMADRVMPLQTDETAAANYQRTFEEAGCKFYLGVGAQDAQVDGQGDITAVRLSTGEEIPCDFVIAAAGVRPRIAFLEGTGIRCERGVCVNEYLETSIPDIYAAGDVTGLSGVWPDAMKQGEIAAINMAGGRADYTDVYPFKNTSNFYGITMLSLGRLDQTDGCQVIVRECRDSYRKAIVKDNVLQAILIQGDISNTGIYLYLIQNKIPLPPDRDVFHLSFADFYGIDGRTGEYAYAVCR